SPRCPSARAPESSPPACLLLPFFSVMYRLFLSPAVAGRPNGLLGHTLLGAPLGAHWLSGPGPLSAQGLVFAGLYLLTTTTWTVTERRLLRRKASQLRAPKPPRRGAAARTSAGPRGTTTYRGRCSRRPARC